MPKNLKSLESFDKKTLKILKKNPSFVIKFNKSINLLRENPFHSGLKSHLIRNNNLFGNIYSCRVTADIRILWSFDQKSVDTIILIDIGGHDDVY